MLSVDIDHTDKLIELIAECRRMRLSIVPPDVNKSKYAFFVDEQDAILYGLSAIKEMGSGAVEVIMAARENGGIFHDLFEFCQRVDQKKVTRRVIEQLVCAGAFDSFNIARGSLMEQIPYRTP